MFNITVKPTVPAKRIDQIDILRGVALFGILMVNVFGYHASFYHFGEFYQGLEDPFQKSIFTWMVNLGSDKFIFMFSMLFGFGLWMLQKKFGQKEPAFRVFFMRRMFWLFVFGLLHIVFFWAGDILLIYSILGVILFFMRRLPLKALLGLSVFFYFFTAIYLTIRIYLPGMPDPMSTTTNLSMDQIVEVYSNGNFFEILNFRVNEYIVFRNINMLYYMPKVMALFILGYMAGRRNLLEYINKNRFRFTLSATVFLVIGFVFIFRLEYILYFFTQPNSNAVMPFYILIYETGNLFLGLAYILAVLLISKSFLGHQLLGVLKYAGRLPLTNYLMQSLIFTTIFYGYGFGLFGSVNPSQFIIWALIVFVIQVVISKWWFSRFKFGPVEFLWRRLSYGNRMKK